MQYVMLIAGEGKPDLNDADEAAMYEKVGQWFADLGAKGKIIGGNELQGAETAKTVRTNGGRATVTDGPFIESKEILGGYAVLECASLEEAVEIAKSWPTPDSVLEVRPTVFHDEV